MMHRVLGRTGLSVSTVAFGAGPVSGLMTGTDEASQRATLERAFAIGVNWIDTAAGYGNGASERNLGRVLRELKPEGIHIATKVRIPDEGFGDIAGSVRKSVEASLHRLGLPRITLLQLHNGITMERGDEPASVAVDDLPEIASALQSMRDEGLTGFIGLTGTGHREALRSAIRSGEFDTLQVPYNLLNPSAGQPISVPGETDYGNVMADCAEINMGVFAIRVFAGGALLDREPSAHTLTTPYFPLVLYLRDRERAVGLRNSVGPSMARRALRFALDHPAVSSAIVGLGSPAEIDELTDSETIRERCDA